MRTHRKITFSNHAIKVAMQFPPFFFSTCIIMEMRGRCNEMERKLNIYICNMSLWHKLMALWTRVEGGGARAAAHIHTPWIYRKMWNHKSETKVIQIYTVRCYLEKQTCQHFSISFAATVNWQHFAFTLLRYTWMAWVIDMGWDNWGVWQLTPFGNLYFNNTIQLLHLTSPCKENRSFARFV